MSLRTDIHSAYDEIAPSTLGLSERVVRSASIHGAPRGRGVTVRLHAPLSLVAAVLLTALVVVGLAGGRLVQDWNAFRNAGPVVGPRPSQLAELESRQLVLPPLNAGDPCPHTPLNANGVYSSAKVGLKPGSSVSTTWGTYWYLSAETSADMRGPVLLRGLDLRTRQHVIFVGNFATGPITGTDTLGGAPLLQHLDLILDTSHPLPAYMGPGEFSWPFTAGLPSGQSGCIGWQIDGVGFTETMVTPG